MSSTRSFSTQRVMPSGIQTSRPATKYRLSVAPMEAGSGGAGTARRAGAFCAVGLALGLAFALALGLAVGFAFALAVACCLLGRGRCIGLGCWRRSTALEVGRIPAAALQLEARGGQHLREGGLAASGAGGDRRVAHLLQEFLLVAAARAPVLVNRHQGLRKSAKSHFNTRTWRNCAVRQKITARAWPGGGGWTTRPRRRAGPPSPRRPASCRARRPPRRRRAAGPYGSHSARPRAPPRPRPRGLRALWRRAATSPKAASRPTRGRAGTRSRRAAAPWSPGERAHRRGMRPPWWK